MFMPPTPASRNLRPTEGMASNSSTRTPASARTSAAISRAGPPPMTATRGAAGWAGGWLGMAAVIGAKGRILTGRSQRGAGLQGQRFPDPLGAVVQNAVAAGQGQAVLFVAAP